MQYRSRIRKYAWITAGCSPFPQLSAPLLLLGRAETYPEGEPTAGKRLSSPATRRTHTAHWQSPSSQLKLRGCCGFHYVLCRISLSTLGHSCLGLKKKKRALFFPNPVTITAVWAVSMIQVKNFKITTVRVSCCDTVIHKWEKILPLWSKHETALC